MDIQGLLDLGSPALVAMLTMAITQAFKATKYLPNEAMPLVALVIGATGYGLLEGFSGQNVIIGIIVGFAATGGHQFIRQSLKGLSGDTTTHSES